MAPLDAVELGSIRQAVREMSHGYLFGFHPALLADDFFQEGAIAVLRARERTRADASAAERAAWLHRRAKGAMRDALRRENSCDGGVLRHGGARITNPSRLTSLDAARGVDDDRPAFEPAHLDTPEALLAAQQLARAVEALPPRLAQVLALFARGDKSPEIGAVLGVSEDRALQLRQTAFEQLLPRMFDSSAARAARAADDETVRLLKFELSKARDLKANPRRRPRWSGESF